MSLICIRVDFWAYTEVNNDLDGAWHPCKPYLTELTQSSAPQVFLNPKPDLSSLPLKSYYRLAMPTFLTSGEFNAQGISWRCARRRSLTEKAKPASGA